MVLQIAVESRVRKRFEIREGAIACAPIIKIRPAGASTDAALHFEIALHDFNPEEKPMNRPDSKINRREFLQKGAVVAAGSATLSTTALSYARVAGANDRISLGHIGIGNRGRELDGIVALLKDKKNVEVTAVCDLWADNREQAVAANQKYFGKTPRSLQHPQELLALKDVDAVMISTPEHSHSPLLQMTVEAGKDAYCEKPMGNILEEVKAARDAVV